MLPATYAQFTPTTLARAGCSLLCISDAQVLFRLAEDAVGKFAGGYKLPKTVALTTLLLPVFITSEIIRNEIVPKVYTLTLSDVCGIIVVTRTSMEDA